MGYPIRNGQLNYRNFWSNTGSHSRLKRLPSRRVAVITFLHAFSVMTFMFSWNALNDLLDVEIDRINRPERPLPSGNIAIKSAKTGVTITGLSSILSLTAAGYVAWSGETGLSNWVPALGIWGFALLFLFNYESASKLSLRMKEKGLFQEILP